MDKQVKILIEGDFIDSFIYSGVLFLVDADLVLKAYSWDQIFKHSISDLAFRNKYRLENYSKGQISSIPEELKKTYSVNNKILSKFELCSKELRVWPSDINIYKNQFYVASEFGVDALDFDWDHGFISKFSSVNRIFNEVSFKLATNTHYRLAIAAGKSGVISVIPDMKYVKKDNVKQIISEPSLDCQWHHNSLIATTDKGGISASFLDIPKQIDFDGTDKEYWDKVKETKKVPPKIKSVDSIYGSRIISSWFAGNKTFNLTESKKLYLHDFKKPEQYEKIDVMSELTTLRYFKAQSSPFGTIMEIGDSLKFFSGHECKTIDEEVSNWRLFPKSTNYLNHLHVIKDDYLSVSLFDMYEPEESDKFGYSKTDYL